MPSYRPMPTTVAVVGDYDGVRDFAYKIMKAERLLNMHHVKWERVRNTAETRLSMTVTRYVTDGPLPNMSPDEPEEDVVEDDDPTSESDLLQGES